MPNKNPTFLRSEELPPPQTLHEITKMRWSMKRSPRIQSVENAYKIYYSEWKGIRDKGVSVVTKENMFQVPSAISDELKEWEKIQLRGKEIYPPLMLFNALSAYKLNKNWDEKGRNKGQILEKLHNYLLNFHPEMQQGDAELVKMQESINIDSVHARLGVLYLFAHIKANVSHVQQISTGISALFDAGLSNKIEKLDDVKEFKFAIGKADIEADHVKSGIEKVSGFVTKLTIVSEKSTSQPVNIPPFITIENNFSFKNLWLKIKIKFTELCEYVVNKFYSVKNLIYKNENNLYLAGSSIFKAILGKGLERLLKDFSSCATGLAGDIGKAATAFITVISKAIDCVKVGKSASRLRLNPGHPQLIVNAIKEAVSDELKDAGFELFTSTLTAVLTAALAAVSAGTSQIITIVINAVITSLKWFFDTYKTYREAIDINKFSLKAMVEYNNSRLFINNVYDNNTRLDTTKGQVQAQSQSICHNLIRFTEFFEEACASSSLLPLLALNSGIVGNSSVFVRIVDDLQNKMVVDEKTEMRGYIQTSEEILSGFKIKARAALNATGIIFTSSLPDVQGYINHAVRHHQQGAMNAAGRLQALAGLK